MKLPPRPRFSFSDLILWFLDAIFFLSTLVLALGIILIDFKEPLKASIKFNGQPVQVWFSILSAHVIALVFLSALWSVHLVLSLTRHGKPFIRKDVTALNYISIFTIFYGLLKYEPYFNWNYTDGRVQITQLGFHTPPHDLLGWFSGPLFWGFVLSAVAAVFSKGVQLREAERQLRQEQELTI